MRQQPICLLRADAGPGIGGGHVTRSLSLAAALKERGWRIVLASRRPTFETMPQAAQAVDLAIALEQDEAFEADEIQRACPAASVAIVDHYGRDAAFERKLRKVAGRIVVLDDEAGLRRHDADLLIDPGPGNAASAWLAALPPRSTVLSGADYALLPQTVTGRRGNGDVRDRVARVLVSFGLSDSHNMSTHAIVAARRACPDAQVDVVVGPASKHRRQVEEAAVQSRASVHVAPANYIDLVVSSDLVIGAGGVSALERAYLGVPSVVIATAANQQPAIAALGATQAVVQAGSAAAFDAGALTAAVARAAGDGVLRRKLASAGRAMIDGRGTQRVADAVEKLAAGRDSAA